MVVGLHQDLPALLNGVLLALLQADVERLPSLIDLHELCARRVGFKGALSRALALCVQLGLKLEDLEHSTASVFGPAVGRLGLAAAWRAG